jgi:hypothetical protein
VYLVELMWSGGDGWEVFVYTHILSARSRFPTPPPTSWLPYLSGDLSVMKGIYWRKSSLPSVYFSGIDSRCLGAHWCQVRCW